MHRHSRALMCLWVALLGCVGRMLQWRATHTGTTVREWMGIVWVLDCRVLSGWPGRAHPPPPLGWESTPPTHLDWESTHLKGQGGHHPNAWTRGGYPRQLLCVTWVMGWVGSVGRRGRGGRGGTCHRFGNSSPNPPRWEPRVNAPDSALGIQPFIGQHPRRWVRGGVLAGHCCRSHRGWVVMGWFMCGGWSVYICSLEFLRAIVGVR